VGPGWGIALFAACTVGLLGCGGGPSFTASEFVDKVNSEGLSMELGRRLPAGGDAKELYAVRLPLPATGSRPAATPAACSASRRRTSWSC
jgi:hypothetical protein